MAGEGEDMFFGESADQQPGLPAAPPPQGERPQRPPDVRFAEVFVESAADETQEDKGVPVLDNRKKASLIAPVNGKRALFLNMRKLAGYGGQRGVAFPYNRAAIFVRQAQFMRDFEDDYGHEAGFTMFYPDYQSMGYEQLRTYFTWRARVRAGEVRKTDAAYVFVYLYELLNNVGVTGFFDGLNKLMFLWQAYRPYFEKLDAYMQNWVRDYYIVNDCPVSFEELLEKQPFLRPFYPIEQPESAFDEYEKFADYRLKKSLFYKGHEQLLNDCFDFVMNRLEALCQSASCGLNDLLFLRNSPHRWQPFTSALYVPQNGPEKTVRLPGGRVYTLKRGEWFCTPGKMCTKNGKMILGYMLKRMEQILRQTVRFKYKLEASDKRIDKSQLNRKIPAVGSERFLSEIDRAVKEFYAQSTRTVVKVDSANLEKIRQNALVTQEKLLDACEDGNAAEPVLSIGDDLTESVFPEADHREESILSSETAPPAPAVPAASGWKLLAGSLDAAEETALKMILRHAPAQEIRAFIKGSGRMPEVLIDGINQKALAAVGDSVIEAADGIAVFDEYETELISIFR